MSKTRLYTRTRNILIAHARSKIVCPVEQAAVQQALVALTDTTTPLAEEHFPSRDMAVLNKYRKVTTQSFIELKRETNDTCEHVPVASPRWFPTNRYGNSCEQVVTLPDTHDVWPLLRTWKLAREQHDAARAAKLADYTALINAMRNFEDVVAVWPEAQEMTERVGQQAALPLVHVNEDLVARIKADVATRASA